MQIAVFYQSRYYSVKLHTILLAAGSGSQRAVEERASLTPSEVLPCAPTIGLRQTRSRRAPQPYVSSEKGKAMHVSWNEFKEIASDDVEADGAYIYRGQSDATWSLVSSLFRTDIVNNKSDIIGYVNYILPQVQESVEAWSGQLWNLADYHGLAEFLAYLQHNGFPTPLLDFTVSPYIATYFAFSDVNHFNPKSNEVAIYRFNKRLWSELFNEKTDIADIKPNVSVLRPYIRGNHKLALQQGLFLWSNIADIEGHIENHEESGGQYITKYILCVTERPRVIKELSLMGISAVQLNPSIESVCKKALEDIIGLIPMGNNDGQHKNC